MKSRLLSKKKQRLFLTIVFSICASFNTSLGEPFGGQLQHVVIAGRGKYVIGSYTGPFIVLWDIDRLWDYLQPTQVHAFMGDASRTTGAKHIAVSQDGKWLAYEDTNPTHIYVCSMERGFTCRTLPLSGEDSPYLNLSPDGDRLLVMTGTKLMMVDLVHGDKILMRREHNWNGQKCLRVDWVRGRIAVGTEDGYVSLLNLKDLEEMQRIKGSPARCCEIAFTRSGKHVIVSWEHWDGEAKNLEKKVQVFPITSATSDTTLPVMADGVKYVVRSDSPGALWYVSPAGAGDLLLTRIGPSGEKNVKESITIKTTHSCIVQGVSEKRDYILMSEGDSLYLIDLNSHLPMVELYNSKVKYWTTGSTLPHLTPRLGADLPYEMLESLSHDIYWDPHNRFMANAWHKEHLYRERGSLWTAALVTKRRARYDKVWFSLLVLLRDHKVQEPTYLHLSELTSFLVQLNTQEGQDR
jgi:hypothetical protein